LKTESSFCVPVMDPINDIRSPVRRCDRRADEGRVPVGVTDILTIGGEATVFRPIRRALRHSGWAVAHAATFESALRYLQSHVAAVAVTGSEVGGENWEVVVSRLSALPDAPEIIVLTWDELSLDDVMRGGAFDIVRCPTADADLLWTVASAWHAWMKQRERSPGGGPCSDA
jgi:DNA-binding NtrC family response regulator